jgi:hypothetical protein
MTLKDIGRRTATLDTLHKAIGEELKAAKAELDAGLRAAKADTGTQKISIDLDGQDIGTATLVQPTAAATVTDEEAFTAWVIGQGERFASEITREVKVVTTVRKAFVDLLLKQMTAAGVAQWADPETGEIHDVPGVEMQGRAAYMRVTIPADGKAAIGQAWRDGRLTDVLPAIAPAAIEPGDTDTAKLQARIAQLEKRDAWLSALEAAGVDNWEGFDVARDVLNGGDPR